MNPIALGLIGTGALLLLFGIFFIVKSKKTTGIILSSLGLIAIATPFIISYFLAR
jgi:hypothetical protein